MLRTVASLGTFGCHDRPFFVINVLATYNSCTRRTTGKKHKMPKKYVPKKPQPGQMSLTSMGVTTRTTARTRKVREALPSHPAYHTEYDKWKTESLDQLDEKFRCEGQGTDIVNNIKDFLMLQGKSRGSRHTTTGPSRKNNFDFGWVGEKK